MQKLSYLKPQTLKEALGYLKEYGEKVEPYAGGTDLMVQLREGSSRLKDVEYLMDVQALPELRGIEVREDSIRIGAIDQPPPRSNESEVLRKHVPFLSIASSTVVPPRSATRHRGRQHLQRLPRGRHPLSLCGAERPPGGWSAWTGSGK